LTKSLGKHAQHIEGQRGILLDQVREGVSGEKEKATFGNRLGMGGKMLTREDRNFTKRLARFEDMRQLHRSRRPHPLQKR
jgi:hypothetical protein